LIKSYKEKNGVLVSMRGQTVKILQKKSELFHPDWTRDVTTIDSSGSKNRGEIYTIKLGKRNNRLSPVFNITELTSSKLTLNL